MHYPVQQLSVYVVLVMDLWLLAIHGVLHTDIRLNNAVFLVGLTISGRSCTLYYEYSYTGQG